MAARVEKLAKDPDEMGELERRLRAASLKSADARAKDTGVDHIGAHVASLVNHRKETRLAATAARREAREERARKVKERAVAARLEKEERTAANLRRKETKKEREAQEARQRAEADAKAAAEAERRRRRGGKRCGRGGDALDVWRWGRGRLPSDRRAATRGGSRRRRARDPAVVARVQVPRGGARTDPRGSVHPG